MRTDKERSRKQKIAPVQFEIRNGRLAILNVPSSPDQEDEENVSIAKEELEKAGDKILQELERSNCDRRLLESVRHLQEQLTSNNNVIRIGLSNLTCEAMYHTFQHELPDAVSAMLRAHTRGIDLFVPQFPEWHRFVENAASTNLDEQDVVTLASAASHIITRLESDTKLAEPEVPKTVKHINELLQIPKKAGKRAAFAMLRTLESMIGSVFSHAADFLEQTASAAVDHASTKLGKRGSNHTIGLSASWRGHNQSNCGQGVGGTMASRGN
jgi:hypothetical protein